MDKSATILSYAVRPRVTAHLGALACLALTPMPLVPAIVALINGETGFAWRLGGVFAALAGFGLLARSKRPQAPRLNEALVVMALAFIIPPLCMAWALSVFGLSAIDAIFLAVAGLTTTGLSVLPAPETLPQTLLFTRSWMQWVGGLGFAVLVLGLMGGAGASAARRLNQAQPMGDDPLAPAHERARMMVVVYVALSLACFFALWATGPDAWTSLLYALSTLSTGGFAPHSDSAAHLGGAAPQIILIGFSTLGAISFSLYLYALRRKRLPDSLRNDVITLFVLAAISIAGLAGFMALEGYSAGEIARHAPFMGLAAQTNVGFTTIAPSDLPTAGLVFMMAAMWIGGNSGSTAGGIKTFRAMIVLAMVRLSLQRTSLPPDAVTRLSAQGRLVRREQLEGVLTVAVLSIATIFAAWLPFQLAGYGVAALFDVVSAVSTAGLSVGVIGPELEPGLKAVIIACMILGRIEFVALFVLVWPPTWLGGAPRKS
ncbi:MAG: TrkH family potassium uptake protein [Oceanicaulis sp.]